MRIIKKGKKSVKLPWNAKACLVGRETSKGWEISLEVGNASFPIKNLLIENHGEDFNKLIALFGESEPVFVHMKKTKCTETDCKG